MPIFNVICLHLLQGAIEQTGDYKNKEMRPKLNNCEDEKCENFVDN